MRSASVVALLSLLTACPRFSETGARPAEAEPAARDDGARPGDLEERGVALLERPLEPSIRGRLSILLTDAPSDANITAVNICFARVDVRFQGGDWRTIIDAPGTFDLLALQGGVTTALGVATLPSGIIDEIRVVVCETGNTLVVDDQLEPLFIPSGTETGIKLRKPGGFELRDNLTTTVIVDFDAKNSVHFAKGRGWQLAPVVRLIDAVTLSITAPVAGEFIPQQPFAVAGTFSSRKTDPVVSITVNGFDAVLDDGTFTGLTRTPTTSPTASVLVVATTAEGIQAFVDVVIAVDSEPPSIAITAPSSGSLIVGDVNVSVAAIDNIGVDLVALLVDGEDAGADPSSPYGFVVSALAPGTHTFSATATDLSGNTSTSTITLVGASVSSSFSTIVAAPASVGADGVSSMQLIVTLRDTSGAVIGGVSGGAITLTPTGQGNMITQPTQPTDDAGRSTGALMSTVAEFKHLSATIAMIGAPPVEIVGPVVAFTATERCGNGMVDFGEFCDDANRVSGDGCRSDCRGEIGIDGGGLGDYVNIDVTYVAPLQVILSCQDCETIVDASVHEIPDLFDTRTRSASSFGSIVAVDDGGRSVTLALHRPIGSYVALAFDVVVQGRGHIAAAAPQRFYRVLAGGDADELSWGEYMCASGRATCAGRASGNITTIFIPE